MPNIYRSTAIAVLLIAGIGVAGALMSHVAPAEGTVGILLQWGGGGALLLALAGTAWWWWRTTAKLGLNPRLPLRIRQEAGVTLATGIRIIVLLSLVDAGLKLGGLFAHVLGIDRSELPTSLPLAGGDLLLALFLCGLLREEGHQTAEG